MAAKERKIPAPPLNPEVQPYWDGATAGRLMIMRCKDTGKPYFYPRAHSPFTGSENVEWVEAKGTGVIYSWSVLRRAPEPYALAYVTLDEGVTMLTNIVDCDFDKLACGQKVKVVFKPTEGGPPAPCFAPT
ncbi:MAG: Zn-ribbon domain-containing OB-fold protein [Alphaproteobacteria bacterium]|nr:Zn-ribbon domain-containing OB-fold protein [Alphaproteobacteria bacterium]